MRDRISRVRKMQDQKCGTNFTLWFEFLKTQNVLCIVVLHLYYFMLECTDYFVIAKVTSACN